MNDSTSVGKRLQNLEISPEFDTYTMVILHVGQITDADGKTADLDYIAGNTSGRTLEVTDPFGTQEKANALLAQLNGWQYQPYTADSALLDPAAEPGDGITLSDTYSAIYKRDVTFSSLMAAKLEAPTDEEIDHEFPYISQSEREYKRETAFTRSQLKINENSISAEVARVDQDILNPNNQNSLVSRINITASGISSEVTRVNKWVFGSNSTSASYQPTETITSRIEQNATNITAKVSKKSGTNTLGFGWDLSDSEWKVGPYSGGKVNPVLTINKNELYVKGNGEFTGIITATSGYIGTETNGFKITASAIYNGITSMSDTSHNGIYLGKDGIRLGKGNFNVTSGGVMTAKSGEIGGITMSSSYGLYTSGKTSRTSTASGFLLSKNGALYLGPYNADNGACPFEVSSSGKVTATNLAIKGGSITIGENFSVTSKGNVTANNMKLTGTLTVGSSTITADRLRQGSNYAYEGHDNWDGAYRSTSEGGYCYTGASNGNSAQTTWNTAQTRNGGLSYIEANDVCARRALWLGDTEYGIGTIDVPTSGYIEIGSRTYIITFDSYDHKSCMRPKG